MSDTELPASSVDPVNKPVDKRTLANRANAQKSTGPKTAKGKSASSRNAVKHGLFCCELVIEDPDEREEFERFCKQMQQRFRPADRLEQTLLERFINAAWRMRRVQSAEADVIEKIRWRDGKTLRLGHLICFGDECLDNLLRYEQGFERSMYRALTHLQRAQKLRKQEQKEAAKERAALTEASAAAPVAKDLVRFDEPPLEPVDANAPCKNEPILPEEPSTATVEHTVACADPTPIVAEPPGKNEPISPVKPNDPDEPPAASEASDPPDEEPHQHSTSSADERSPDGSGKPIPRKELCPDKYPQRSGANRSGVHHGPNEDDSP